MHLLVTSGKFSLVAFHIVWKTVVVDAKRKRGKFLVSNEHCFHLAHVAVINILGNLEHSLCLVVQLGTNMATGVVIAFVQVKHCVNVKVIET